MDANITDHLDDIIRLAKQTFKQASHLHLHDKTELQLTDEITFADFVIWLQKNSPLIG